MIHPPIKPYFIIGYPIQDLRLAGGYTSCHRARSGVHPGQAHSLLQGQHIESDKYVHLHSLESRITSQPNKHVLGLCWAAQVSGQNR